MVRNCHILSFNMKYKFVLKYTILLLRSNIHEHDTEYVTSLASDTLKNSLGNNRI